MAGAWLGACGGSAVTDQSAATPGPPEFVGSESCIRCHETENRFWTGSHHDRAMEEATSSTVLGDFNDATFTYAGVTSTFSSRDGKFFVRTDGSDGELEEYEIAYTFGFNPLQQYLIEFPGGRYQALPISWDNRPADEGGQRWFHLYPEGGSNDLPGDPPSNPITHEDPLHWTGPLQNWNYMCAECHSTNVKKDYRSSEDSYETTWSEIDVSCEACHGAGSEHVTWAKAVERGENPREVEHFGLAVRLEDPGRDTWLVNPETGKGMRLAPTVKTSEMETCARCHSRRTSLTDDYVFGRPLGDTHRLAALDEGLYHVDGQILDEVYVYGSFLQSKMYQAGVTCSDCHEPHNQQLYFPGDDVCARCHAAKTFDSRDHHFHQPETEGSHCVDCHMPPKNYMVVDPRHDHSMRVPRPDLSMELGTPNACNSCHQDRSIQWAVDAVAKWYGPDRRQEPHYGQVLAAARRGEAEAGKALSDLLADPEMPAIVKASALEILPAFLTPASLKAVQAALADPDPLVRRAALTVVGAIEPRARVGLALPLVTDPVRTVRTQAARVLAGVPGDAIPDVVRAAVAGALGEYEADQLFNADRAEGRLNHAGLLLERGEPALAESEFEQALRMAPWFAPAYVNFADHLRTQGRDDEGERLLRRGLEATDGAPEIHHTLGLLLVRKRRLSEALGHLETAAALSPETSRYNYVYGIALNSSGDSAGALRALERAHEAFPADREVLSGLVSIHREAGHADDALRYARKLRDLLPGEPGVERLVAELESGQS
jgi:tetratricopeptide (TPR) repeat protein